MDESVVRMQAEMYALVAEMNAVIANIEAMKADNLVRESLDQALAWPSDCFTDAQFELEKIAQRLRNEI